jgi:EpsD family peptidyl-prolyl cis-trans isomerase
MISRSDATTSSGRRLRHVVALSTAAAVLMLVGCGERPKDKAVSQTAARVNNEEITVHQINFRLSQQRALPPEQAASATRVVLERLIDQDLVLQKAGEQKLDREPGVMQQIEAARRDVIAQAYLAKLGDGAPKPTEQEVKAYYEANPALFKERRIYSLQELDIEAKPEQLAALKSQLEAAKNLPEYIAFLKSHDYKFRGGEAVRAAEQLPLSSVATFAKMKDGQTIFNATPTGAQVILLAGSRTQPVTEEQAAPAIEQFLLNERKRKLISDDMKALRAAAKIEYVGEFAKDAPKPLPPEPEKPFDAALTTVAPPSSAPLAAPQVDVPVPPVTAASMPSSSVLERGLQGMK